MATAESLTGGLVCAALTDVAGASDVVRGAVVAYATELKSSLLAVDSEVLSQYGAVHPSVAEAMAVEVRSRCGADWGIALTGVAGPDPQDGVAVGTIHLGFAGRVGARVVTRHLDGDRRAIRTAAVRVALEQFAEVVR